MIKIFKSKKIMSEIVNQKSACPIHSITELLNRKWVFGILRDMFLGKKHFNEFKTSQPNMSNVVLSDTLKYLEKQGLIIKNVCYEESQKKTEYYLTEKGEKINAVLYEMVLYGLYVLEDELRTEEYKKQIKEEYEEILNIN